MQEGGPRVDISEKSWNKDITRSQIMSLVVKTVNDCFILSSF